MPCFFLFVLLILALNGMAFVPSAQARPLGEITSSDDPDFSAPTNDSYSISCISNIEGASVFVAPDTKRPFIPSGGYTGKFTFPKGASFEAEEIVEAKEAQFLAGKLIAFSQGSISSWEKPGSNPNDEHRDRLYVLSKEWDCSLYKE